MALTDVFLRQVQYKGAATGEKYTDGKGLYLHVTNGGKYWRLNYRYAGKQKTLYIGVYPEVSLALARRRMEGARAALVEGDDPGALKREAKTDKLIEAATTFEGLALLWLSKMAVTRTKKTQAKASNWLEHDVFPYIGKLSVATIRPRDILRVVQRVEARGAIDSSHRIKQVCGQVLPLGHPLQEPVDDHALQGFLHRLATFIGKKLFDVAPGEDIHASAIELCKLANEVYFFHKSTSTLIKSRVPGNLV